jgi:outer membrane receptor protein involved in Fe transport
LLTRVLKKHLKEKVPQLEGARPCFPGRPLITGRIAGWTGIGAAPFACAAAMAAENVSAFQFALPRQPLAVSLEAIGTRTRSNIFFSPDTVRGRTAPALKGIYGTTDALRRLLAGSGLGVTMTSGGSYIIAAQAIKKPTPPPPPAVVARPAFRAPVADDNIAGAIVVTGSRIDAAGFEAPTPTLHIARRSLLIGARANIAASLNDLPQFRGTTSAQTTGTNIASGTASVDLRGLGINRTLVLLDGRRFSGDVDLNTIPTVLVKSVDVVTGGASAAWGSGAVAGVVNIVIDGDFTGLRFGAQGGISSRGDAAERRFEGAAGLRFADGRGHFVIGGEYLDNAGIIPKSSRKTVGRWSVVSAGNGVFRIAPDVGFANAAYGGVILSGALAGKAFNPDGSLRDFETGTVIGNDMIGGEGPSNDDISPLVTPQRRYSALGRFTYDLTDTIKVTAEVRHSRMWNNHIWFGDNNRGNITISIDNAFLSSAIRQQLTDAGQSSFTMGRFNSDFPFPRIDFQRLTTQGTLAFDGAIGSVWRWSAYYSHGEYRNDIDTPGFVLGANFTQAVDSVRDPVTNQPICRITLTDPSSKCVPINLFGLGAPSAAALAYITGTPRQRSLTRLDVGGVSLRGEPSSLPAGPLSVAVGIEARRESIHQTVGAQDAVRAFRSFNFAALSGSFVVKEAFAEVLIPLVRDVPLLRRFDLNAAVRVSDYDTTGSVASWKIGATNEFLPGLKGRITRSRDIRSANLTELYTQTTIGFNTITDPVRNMSVYVLGNGGGNPNLRPETANTITAGFTFSPPNDRGFNLSVDYYRIRIANVITTIAAQDLVTRCFNGNLDLCARVERDSQGNITRTVSNYLNLAQYRTDGIDAELSQYVPLRALAGLPGNLTFRLVGSWVNSLTTSDGVSTIEYVRSQGNSFSLGVPKWRVNGSIGYDTEDLGLELRARYISPGNYNSTLNIINNHIPAYTYLDLYAHRTIRSKAWGSMELYLNVANMLDRQAPPGSLYSPFYDVVGRNFSMGARLAF